MQEIVDLDSQEVARVVEQADASAEEELVQLRQERTRHLTERHRVLRLLQCQQEVIARQESELRTRRNDEHPRELGGFGPSCAYAGGGGPPAPAGLRWCVAAAAAAAEAWATAAAHGG